MEDEIEAKELARIIEAFLDTLTAKERVIFMRRYACLLYTSCPKQSVSLETSTENVMSVEVPRYEFKLASEDGGNIYPYGLAQTSGELDDAVRELGDILPDLSLIHILCLRQCRAM